MSDNDKKTKQAIAGLLALAFVYALCAVVAVVMLINSYHVQP